jgi:predicted enzyme related to lactoylglutathione lyase
MANPFVHLELNTPDLAKAKAFYGELFGWKFEEMPMPNGVYSTFLPDSKPGGGMAEMPNLPPMWTAYVGVDDIHASTEKALALGATATHVCHEIPGVGWMTILIDPTGAKISLFQPKM